MEEDTPDISKLTSSIEKLLVDFGRHEDFHAKLLAGAIVKLLKDEGFIADGPDEKDD